MRLLLRHTGKLAPRPTSAAGRAAPRSHPFSAHPGAGGAARAGRHGICGSSADGPVRRRAVRDYSPRRASRRTPPGRGALGAVVPGRSGRGQLVGPSPAAEYAGGCSRAGGAARWPGGVTRPRGRGRAGAVSLRWQWASPRPSPHRCRRPRASFPSRPGWA